MWNGLCVYSRVFYIFSPSTVAYACFIFSRSAARYGCKKALAENVQASPARPFLRVTVSKQWAFLMQFLVMASFHHRSLLDQVLGNQIFWLQFLARC